MFDETRAPPKAQTDEEFSIQMLSIGELLALRAEIDARLPATALADLDLEKELVMQFNTVKALQAGILSDKHVQANQKAQVANSTASTLSQLTRMQTDYYTAERLKAIETALIRMLRTWPEDLTAKFFEEYEALER